MKKIITTLGAVAVSATAAHAGGIDRSSQSTAILFEQGNYVEFSIGHVKPTVSGSLNALPTVKSGNMAKSYVQLGGGLKYKINDNVDAAIIVDQPFGADVSYPVGTGYPFQGATAELNAFSVTGLLKYRTASNVSVFGGIRYQTLEATAGVPIIGGYTVVGSKDGGVGYVVGVAYEKPEIALRVALTYNSKIKHKIDTLEFGALRSVTTVNSPQSVNLEFQSGVAANTLVFGSVRWVEWSKFDINPANYPPAAPLVSYAKNTVTFNLGVGRKLNDNWAVSASLGYEKQGGGLASNLGPTDGKKSLTLGAVYTRDNMKITGGVSYVKVGNANTGTGTFTGSKAVGSIRNSVYEGQPMRF